MRWEFHCLEGSDNKNNVYNKGPQSQCLEGQVENSNVYKNRVESQCLQWRDKIRIPVFSKIDPESQCLQD